MQGPKFEYEVYVPPTPKLGVTQAEDDEKRAKAIEGHLNARGQLGFQVVTKFQGTFFILERERT